MEDIDSWRLKWQNEFGDAPFPCALARKDELGLLSTSDELVEALEYSRKRISALKRELKKEEFVKQCLESRIKNRENAKSENEKVFINEYVYSFVGTENRHSQSPLHDPDFRSRCDSDSVTCNKTKFNSLKRIYASSVKENIRNKFDRSPNERKLHSWSHSRGSNSVKPRAPVPLPTQRVVTVVEDEGESDYGRVWVIPSNCKQTDITSHSTGTMSASQNVSVNPKQPPPVPKKPKPQPAPRSGISKSRSSDLTPCQPTVEVARSYHSLPPDIRVNFSNDMASVESDADRESKPSEEFICDVVGANTSQTGKQSPEHTQEASGESSHCDSFKQDSDDTTSAQEHCARNSINDSHVNSSSITNQINVEPDSDMKKLYRTKSSGKRLLSDGAQLEQVTGIYRKLSDEIEVSPVMEDKSIKVEMRPKKTVPRSEFSSGSGDSTDTVTEVGRLTDKSHDRAPSYENWTIDRCLTRHDDSNDSDEIEGMYDNMVFGEVSPASTLQKFSYKGSKDSGLCDLVDDLSTNGSSPSVSDSVSVNTEGSAVDSAMDAVSKAAATSDEDDDGDVEDVRSDSSDGDDKNADNVSLASDMVFIPASELLKSSKEPAEIQKPNLPPDQDVSPSVLQVSPQIKRVSTESPVVSSGEEEVSFDELDGMPLSARDKQLQMRQLIVKGVLESEQTYLATLELLLHYKRSLQASSKSSKPVVTTEDIDNIFCNMQKLYDIHLEFVTELEPKVKHWSHDQNIGDVFKMMVFKFPEFGLYMENYQKAVSTIHRCSQEDPRFEQIAGEVTICSQTKEVTNLEDALFKPVQRVQRNALVLHDLIKYTPEDHPDFKVLQKALQLSQYNLEQIGSTIFKSGALSEEKRHLVKSSFLVELISGQRKVRYIFLFSDVLVCTKKENSRKGSHYDVKWIIPLCRLSINTHFGYQDDQKHSHKDNIEEMKRKIGTLKSELRDEVKKEESRESKHWSISGLAAARNVERLKKKIQELEAQLILHLPKLPVKLTHQGGKIHTLLMTTDYEREEWLETMTALCKKCGQQDPGLDTYDITEMINSCKELPQVNKLGSVLMQRDEEMLNGTLNVTIHKLNGLTRACDTYCCVEMDSYDHFFMKARTNICPSSVDPSWDEDFELELDGTQTLRVLVYEKVDQKSDRLLGRGAIELSKSWLKTNFQEKTICMNDVSLVISVRHTPANRTMRRTPSQQKTAVFGVKISTCARREGKTIPTIVTACIQEVEKRGTDETGIYRVSGVTSEVQRLKKAFDKNVRAGANIITECDIHAVTGVLKLYFRELPEPLFTEANYTNFVDALRLSDKEAKEKCMLALLHNLPDANYYTIVTLMEHLVRVVKNVKENKMTVHNLATVFGPTLLAPAAKETELVSIEMMSKNTEQVMRQSAIVNYFLTLAVQGRSLRRSAQC